jgi:hypothetical protein
VNHEFLGAHRYDVDQRHCPVLLVGEDNPHSEDPKDALYPYPVGTAGYNLAENITDVGVGHQLATWRTNLCSPRWSAKAARERALALVKAPGVPWRVIIMLGAKVASAFKSALESTHVDIKLEPFTTYRALHSIDDKSSFFAKLEWITLVSLPHPSGRCRVWKDEAQVHRARVLLATAAPTWYGDCST